VDDDEAMTTAAAQAVSDFRFCVILLESLEQSLHPAKLAFRRDNLGLDGCDRDEGSSTSGGDTCPQSRIGLMPDILSAAVMSSSELLHGCLQCRFT
jgi:hypothetical protein